jgi:hypothetical protein
VAANAPDFMRFVLVACDGGARDALKPVGDALDVALEDIASAECADEAYWRKRFANTVASVLVVGTSDSDQGRRVESAARRSARAAGFPVVAIEDFPGNYSDVRGGEASLAIVESLPARELCVQKLGRLAPPCEVLSPARYDVYRARLAELREATEARWRLQNARSPPVLWAGQPETADCLRTLNALVPALRPCGASVMLKAHPRDPGYAEGSYQKLLEDAAIAYEDMTALSVTDALAAGPRLVITQFSSVAIEAGFYGIPGLCVLLPDAGGARLREKKGYAVPPFCTAGAVDVVSSAKSVEPSLRRLLSDASFRDHLLRSFDDYFDAHASATQKLVSRLNAFARAVPGQQEIHC